jgi:hypothetical protein
MENSPFTLDSVIVRTDQVAFASVDQDVVMLSMETSKYYGTGGVGGQILDLLQQPIRVRDLIARLIEQYEVDAETCQRETLHFLSQLHRAKLVHTVET